MFADLHLHTHYSDGSWSPEALLAEAIRLGFACISITDHDTCAALPEAHAYADGKIRLIDGIEFNTVWTNPQGNEQDVHILGYFIDRHKHSLCSAIKKQQEARLSYVQETLALLASRGLTVELDSVLAYAGKGSPGRPHICKAMLEAGVAASLSQAYGMLINRNSEFRLKRRSISPQDALAAISGAGGISSLAHPGKDKFIPELLDELVPAGLNAIEAYHRGHSNKLVRGYLNMARQRKLLVSGGSDCHGRFDNFPASLGSVKLAYDFVDKLERLYKYSNQQA